jgi:hypothetical protein
MHGRKNIKLNKRIRLYATFRYNDIKIICFGRTGLPSSGFIFQKYINTGAWGAVVVKALRY